VIDADWFWSASGCHGAWPIP